jgi:CRISPR/Cas system CSM-associated protein Csm2 small subunit
LDWVHPSWRDVVIDYLMRRPDERRRFLRRCEMIGLELALSVSGGATGEREQPLLRTADDWIELRRRMIDLIPGQEQSSHRLLLEALRTSLSTTGGELRDSVERAAEELCVGVAEEWNRRNEQLSARGLESFYELSVLLSRLPAGPQLATSVAAWLEQLDGGGAGEGLSGLAFAAENEPRALRQARWPEDHPERVDAVVTAAEQRLIEAQRCLQELEDGITVSAEEVEYHSYEVSIWRRVLDDLERARAADDNSRRIHADLETMQLELQDWIERKEEESEARAQELAEEYYDEEEDEGTDPDAFDIAAVLSDL